MTTTTIAGLADREVLAALLREDLTAFVEQVFATVSPGDAYCHNWHIEAIAHELVRCREGDSTRLIITQPPRSLKSICIRRCASSASATRRSWQASLPASSAWSSTATGTARCSRRCG
jgi:hypothetical protein